MIFLNKDEITSFGNFNNLSIFLTMILDSQDMLLITIAVQITLVMIPKVNELGNHLVREGFVEKIRL